MAINIADAMMRAYIQNIFGGKTASQKEKERLSLESLKRSDELSDLALLNSMLPDATNEQEWELMSKTYKDVENRMSGYDPVVQGKIKSVGRQIGEGSTLYDQFKSATKLVNGLLAQGELEDPTIENLTWEEIVKKNSMLDRFKHVIDSGKQKGYTYEPERGKGEKYLHSNLLSKRLDDYVENFDVLVKFSMDKGDGKDLTPDAKRAIQVGDLAGFEKIKDRDIGTYRGLVNTHSARYSSLYNAKMKADVTKIKNVDGTFSSNLMPAAMIQDLQGQGEEQVKAYMDAIKNNSMLAQAFMGGAKSGSGITVDYDTYSLILNEQMDIEKKYINSANSKFRSYTGEDVETFRESISFETMKKEINKTGLQDGGAGGIEPPPSTVPPPGVKKPSDVGKKPVVSKSTLPQLQGQIMDIISQYKTKYISTVGAEAREKAKEKAIQKYKPAGEKAVAKIESKRKKELDILEFTYYPTQNMKNIAIKAVNDKYDRQIKGIKFEKGLSRAGKFVPKTPSVDELFSEMGVFQKLLGGKVDFNILGISNNNQRELRKLISQYRDAKASGFK